MNRWNPAAKARNFVARVREMSDNVVALRGEFDQLRSELDRTTRVQNAAVLDAAERASHAAARGAVHLTLRRETTRVVFLAHNREAWDALDEVVSIMRDSGDFEPIVVSIPHHYGGDAAPLGEDGMHEFLVGRGVPHLRLRDDDTASAGELMRALDPDIVFRQSQWDADIDAAFSAAGLAWARLALIPYETMNPTVNVPWGDPPINSAVDQRWHRAAWLVFCANDDALEIAREDTITGGRQFRAVGHPKADALRRTPAEWPFAAGATRRHRVAWSAHHSILEGWNDFGTFPRVKDEMLAWASAEPGTEFVFLHHPYLKGTIRREDGPIGEAEFEEWLTAWESLPNAAYWRGPYAPVLAATDLLVTDGPSMITEAQVLSVPTVFLERAEHIPFNRIGERIVSGVHRVPDVAGARTVAAMLLEAPDPLAELQRQNVEALFGAPGAAERIVETIRSEIIVERGRR